MKIQNALVSNILDRSQRYFAHVTTVTLSWRVQNIVVIGRVHFTLEYFEFSSNFEFDRNMLSGTGASILLTHSGRVTQLDLIRPLGINSNQNSIKIYTFSHRKSIWKCCLQNGGQCVMASMCQSIENMCHNRFIHIHICHQSRGLALIWSTFSSRVHRIH